MKKNNHPNDKEKKTIKIKKFFYPNDLINSRHGFSIKIIPDRPEHTCYVLKTLHFPSETNTTTFLIEIEITENF